jgi:glycosyltransferase involved in cell wall biosynthesis
MEPKLISIVTPTFNCGPKIEKTINSVLSQNRDLIEFIIVDGDSTDGSLNIVEKHADKINLVSEKDGGVYEAMNKGIEMSTGKYLYFLGGGDSLKEDILIKLEGLLPRNDLALVYGNVYMVDLGVVYDGEFDRTKLRKRNICQQAIFYERRVFDVMGGFETRFNVLADHAFNLKCFWNDRIQKKYVGYVIANYEGGGISERERDVSFSQDYAELMSLVDG